MPVRLEELPQRIPVFPLAGAILLPGARLPLNIFEPRYLAMIRDTVTGDGLIGMIQPADPSASDHEPETYEVGCAGRITEQQDTPDGRIVIALTGVCRFRITQELQRDTPYRQVHADFATFEADLTEEFAPALTGRELLIRTLKAFLDHNGLKVDWSAAARAPDQALVNSLSMLLPLSPAEKQALLESATLAERADLLTALLGMAALEGDDGDAPVQ